MARMLPDFVDFSAPASERRVFEAITRAAGSDNWVVLHSLGLSSEWTGNFGEIDFVVVIPNWGIVCIEVKGGGLSVHNGTWTTRNWRGVTKTLKRSPYQQAQEGMWKLLKAIRRRFGEGSAEARCPIGWLVVFPDAPCPPVTPEATRDEIIDRDDMEGPIGDRIRACPSLSRLHERADLRKPGAATCTRIVSFLRPEFERVGAPTSQDWDAETRIRALTEEQFDAIDCIQGNQVALIRGPAGTGKTLLGLESARRASSSGRAALFLCFNLHLGSWVRTAAERFGPGRAIAGNVHALLRERILSSSFAEEFRHAERNTRDRDDLFGRLYFELGALAIEESGERFDHIVFDEVQDLSAKNIGIVAHSWLCSSESGSIVLLGDFTRQALYTGSSECSVPLLERALGPLALFTLRLNCRNTRQIARQTAVLSGFDDLRLSERQPEGEPVTLQFYADARTGLAQLDRIVLALRDAGTKPQDIVILGPRRRERSILAGAFRVGGLPVHDLGQSGEGELAYSTIHAFKGLERPVIILVDVAKASSEEADALLYVGMTRARLRLFIVAPSSAQPVMERRLKAAALAAIGATAS